VRPRALPDIDPRFVCGACSKRGADVRPDFSGKLEQGEVLALLQEAEQQSR
jgi:hypothetical protein